MFFNKQNAWHFDMEFLFLCSTWYLTRWLRSLVRAHSWDVTREVSSSLSTRTKVLSSIVNTFVLGPSVNRRHSTCVDLGWVAKRWKTCFDLVQIWSLLKWAQVIASQRRRKQALAKLERGSQVDTSFQLVSTCESVGQGFKLAHFLIKTWRFVCTLHTVLKATVTAVCFSLFLESWVWDYCGYSDFCKIGTETIAASRPTQNTIKTIKDSKRKRAIRNQRVKTGEEQPLD